MFTKREVMLIVGTLCLTASLFAAVPTESARTATAATYDPWADLNGDGRIDIMDVVGLTGIYGTTGNPARNVNVTNCLGLPIQAY